MSFIFEILKIHFISSLIENDDDFFFKITIKKMFE